MNELTISKIETTRTAAATGEFSVTSITSKSSISELDEGVHSQDPLSFYLVGFHKTH